MKLNKTFRRLGAIVGVTAIAATLAACSSAGSESTPKEMTPVTVGAVFTTAAVPLWIAEEKGFFAKNGLEVTIKQSPNFAASVPSLLNGQMQFANAATAPVITAISKGTPVQIVSGVQAEVANPKLGDDQVMVAQSSTIARPRDLQGKTVATNAVGSGPYVGVMANYLADGGAPNGIKWVVMDLNAQIPALKNGQVDAIVASEPFRVTAADQGFKEVFNAYRVDGLNSVPAGFTDAVLVASTDYLKKNPKIGLAMQKAMNEANAYAQANPQAVKDVLVKKLELDKAVVEKINLPAFVGEVEPRGVQKMIDQMFAIGLITNKLNALDMVWAGN